MGVAEAAVAATQQHDAVAWIDQVGNQSFAILIQDLRAWRHFQHHVGTLGARAVLAHAVTALLGLEVLLVAVVEQRVEIRYALDDHVATPTPGAAVRAAELDEPL